jgi:hypothetical protein
MTISGLLIFMTISGLFIQIDGASVAEWLRLLTSNHLLLTAVGSNPYRDFGFFHVRKLSS